MHLDLRSDVRSLPWEQPISVPPATPVRQVARLMRRFDIGAVIVRADDDHDAGVVTERDLAHLLADGRDPDGTTAAEVASPGLVCVDVGEPVSAAVAAMVSHRVRHVGVSDGDEVVGVVSARDVLRLVSGDPPAPDAEVRATGPVATPRIRSRA